MKKRIIAILCVLLCAFVAVSASEVNAEQSGWISIDAAYYFGGPNGISTVPNSIGWGQQAAFGGLEGRITPWYEIKIPTPLGDSWLVSGDNLKMKAGFELTPVSIMPRFAMSWEILPFLVFSTGVDVGTGWDVGTVFQGGMATTEGINTRLDEKGKHVYVGLVPFADWYTNFWVEGLFQFDAAALVSDSNPNKDKLHIVLQATYKIEYKALSGAKGGEAWEWQLSGDKFNGWGYYSCITLGYMMPNNKALKLAGIQTELEGRLFDDLSVYGYDANWAKFLTVGFNPTLLFEFDEHNSLGCQVRIKNRPVFADADASYYGTVTGMEFFFDRIALSYTYKF